MQIFPYTEGSMLLSSIGELRRVRVGAYGSVGARICERWEALLVCWGEAHADSGRECAQTGERRTLGRG